MTERPQLTALAPVEPGVPIHGGNGYHHLPTDMLPQATITPSAYLRLLPAIYGGDEFVGRFLRIFEDVLDPISILVDNLAYYFDPATAPPDLLNWMAMWVDMKEGAEWPLPRRRALVAAAATLFRMRGTLNGLKRHVGIYSGGLPLVMERTNGFRLVPDARLGINTSIGEERRQMFKVTIAVSRPEDLDMDTLRSIIEADKPVESTYTLRVVKLGPAAAQLGGTWIHWK